MVPTAIYFVIVVGRPSLIINFILDTWVGTISSVTFVFLGSLGYKFFAGTAKNRRKNPC